MKSEDLVGTWTLCIGTENRPEREIGLQPDGSVFGFHDQESSWRHDDRNLYLLDKNRSILSIFDLEGIERNTLRGTVRQVGFSDVSIWLRRLSKAMPARRSSSLQMLQGPLENQAKDAESFCRAWDKHDDFSVVIYPGGYIKALPPTTASRNLGSSESSARFEHNVKVGAPNGYYCMPVFFHVLHDCWLVDGSVAVTRDKKFVYETSQFPGLEPLWDRDYGLLGSKIDAVTQNIVMSDEGPSKYLDIDLFLFSTLKYGYGHWLGQSVPNAYFLDWISTCTADIASHLVIGVNGGLDRESFRVDCLNLLSITNPVLALPRLPVKLKRLIVPSFHRSHSHHWPGIGEVFRKMGSKAISLRPKSSFGKRLYASRRGQLRSFSKDSEIKVALDTFGFQEIIGGSIPFIDQVSAYAQAEAIFGIYGSNMCNISFGGRGSNIVEVFDEDHNDALWEYFLANAGGQNYTYIITPVDRDKGELGFQDRTTDLDPNVLASVLSELGL